MTTPTNHNSKESYADERDDKQFWETVELTREPARLRWYIPAIALLVLGGVPWYFDEGHTGRIIGGLPAWIWISLGCAFGLASITAFAVVRHWRAPDTGDD